MPGTRPGMTILAVSCLLFVMPATAQDIRGLEICTAEKDMTRRTSCLQSNVELLQQELTKQARRAADERANTAKEIASLKAELAAVKNVTSKVQSEIAELKKKSTSEKKQ
jgi:septal ring factor EnvC (AmiA/AmiB activator)